MSELSIKPRQSRTQEEKPAVELAPGRPSKTPKVIKLGAKERLNPYVTPEQKRKLRLLAVDRNCSMSEIIGVLIDEAETPTF